MSDKKKEELKTCSRNPKHIWLADINYCPYCAYTPQERADWAQRTNWGKEKENK